MKHLFLSFLLFSVCILTTNAQKSAIQLNLEKGATYLEISEANIEVSQSMGGQNMVIKSDVFFSVFFTVTDIVGDTYVLDSKVGRFVTNSDNPMGGKITYSSDNEEATTPIDKIFAKIINKSFTTKLNKNGTVEEVIGLNEIWEGATNGVEGLEAPMMQAMVKQLEGSLFSQEGLDKGISGALGYLTSEKVGKGDTWEKEQSVDMNGAGKMKSVTKYEIVDETPEEWTIKANVTTQNDIDQEPIVNQGMEMKFDLKGNGTSTIRVNKNTGWFIEMTNNTKISGMIDIQANAQLPDGMSIPMSVLTETTVKGEL